MKRRDSPRNRRFLVSGRQLRLPFVRGCALLDAGTAFPLDFHAHNGYEICYLLSGETHWILANGDSLHLSGETLSIIQPGVLHQGWFHRIDPCKLVWIDFNPRTPRKPGGIQTIGRRLFSRMDADFEKTGNRTLAGDRTLRAAAETFASAMSSLSSDSIPPDTLVWLQTSVTQIIMAVHSLVTIRHPARSQSGSDMVTRCQAFIQERLAEPVGVTDMARHVGVKPSTFFARFRRHTGMTPSDYLRRARIHRAQDLMLKTGGSILDIAMACGFGSSQYFSATFRKYAGVSPRQFRKRFRRR